MGVKIVGFMPSFNLIEGDYPFLESMLLALPLVDEFFVLDIGSSDGTLGVLEEVAGVNGKVRVVSFVPSVGVAEPFDEAVEWFLGWVEGDWLLEVQADEYFPLGVHSVFRDEVEFAHVNGFNSVRHFRYWLNGFDYGGALVNSSNEFTVRLIRNLGEGRVGSFMIGDGFILDGLKEPGTHHFVPPEFGSKGIVGFNMACTFPLTHLKRLLVKQNTFGWPLEVLVGEELGFWKVENPLELSDEEVLGLVGRAGVSLEELRLRGEFSHSLLLRLEGLVRYEPDFSFLRKYFLDESLVYRG